MMSVRMPARFRHRRGEVAGFAHYSVARLPPEPPLSDPILPVPDDVQDRIRVPFSAAIVRHPDLMLVYRLNGSDARNVNFRRTEIDGLLHEIHDDLSDRPAAHISGGSSLAPHMCFLSGRKSHYDAFLADVGNSPWVFPDNFPHKWLIRIVSAARVTGPARRQRSPLARPGRTLPPSLSVSAAIRTAGRRRRVRAIGCARAAVTLPVALTWAPARGAGLVSPSPGPRAFSSHQTRRSPRRIPVHAGRPAARKCVSDFVLVRSPSVCTRSPRPST